MKVVVDIEKRHVFLIVGIMVFFGGLFFVNAFGGDSPSVMGHDSGEIQIDLDAVSKCRKSY